MLVLCSHAPNQGFYRAISIIRINEGVSTRDSYQGRAVSPFVCACSGRVRRARTSRCAVAGRSPFPTPHAAALADTHPPFPPFTPSSSTMPRSPFSHHLIAYRTWRPMPRREAVVVVSTRHTCVARTRSLLSSVSDVLSREQYRCERATQGEQTGEPDPSSQHLPHTVRHDHDTPNRTEPRSRTPEPQTVPLSVRCPA